MTNNTYPNAYLEGLIARYNTLGWRRCDRGTATAALAYDQTNELGLDVLAVWDMPCTGDMPAFMDTLAGAGITEFLLCDQSSGLMDALHYLLDEGWQVCGVRDNRDEKRPLVGLLMRKGDV